MSIFIFKCKILNQQVVINGSDIINTSDRVWIVQNGIYLTYPKIDREQLLNFPSILSIFYFKKSNYTPKVCNQWLIYQEYRREGSDSKEWQVNQQVVINGSDFINTSDKVWIVQNGIYLTYPKIDPEQL